MRKIIFFITVLLFITVIFRGFWESQFSPVGTDNNLKAFEVKKGESVSSIAERLESEGLIRSKLAFKLALKFNKKSAKVQAGEFKLSPSMSANEIITAMGKGSFEKLVTLQEGWRIEEMAKKLNQELGINEKEFVKSASEGYMFPDTYSFDKGATVPEIVAVMKTTFNQKFTGDLQDKIKKQGLTPDQGVILASIVEREARSEAVRTKVASILLKRLKIDMGLNADATIQYALGFQPQEKSWWKRYLTFEDLKFNSLFNTYLHTGLPPAPISNPGLSSLKAVANADYSTPYLYYYHDLDGNTYYAKTLDEHNRNAANYP